MHYLSLIITGHYYALDLGGTLDDVGGALEDAAGELANLAAGACLCVTGTNVNVRDDGKLCFFLGLNI